MNEAELSTSLAYVLSVCSMLRWSLATANGMGPKFGQSFVAVHWEACIRRGDYILLVTDDDAVPRWFR
jgi:hypothetical protein